MRINYPLRAVFTSKALAMRSGAPRDTPAEIPALGASIYSSRVISSEVSTVPISIDAFEESSLADSKAPGIKFLAPVLASSYTGLISSSSRIFSSCCFIMLLPARVSIFKFRL